MSRDILEERFLKKIQLTKATPISFTVPSGHRYILARISLTYTADATVATRICTVYVNDGVNENHLGKFDITASQLMRWNGGIANPAYAAYEAAGSGWSPQPLAGGDIVTVAISNPQAGDTWTATAYVWDVLE